MGKGNKATNPIEFFNGLHVKRFIRFLVHPGVALLCLCGMNACTKVAIPVNPAQTYVDSVRLPSVTRTTDTTIRIARNHGVTDDVVDFVADTETAVAETSEPLEAPTESPHTTNHGGWVTGGGASAFTRSHPSIDHYIEYYSERAPRIIPASLERAAAYLPMIREAFSQAGVPPEIAYLPIVESHFKNSAYSHAGAAGMWQFIRGTGKRYGLRIDRCVDERRDPERATLAAARYLSELHIRFNDWHLALAAYNAGEGRIEKVMRDHKVYDYWTMVERRLLPRETLRYVPRFLAVVTILENAEAFGVTFPDASVSSNISSVRVERPISLKTVARLAGVERTAVESLNPALGCKRVPRGGYLVQLPIDAMDSFETAYASLSADSFIPGDGVHRVRRGENPATIARRYGVTVSALMKENNIRNPRRLRPNTTLRIPDPI